MTNFFSGNMDGDITIELEHIDLTHPSFFSKDYVDMNGSPVPFLENDKAGKCQCCRDNILFFVLHFWLPDEKIICINCVLQDVNETKKYVSASSYLYRVILEKRNEFLTALLVSQSPFSIGNIMYNSQDGMNIKGQ